MSRQPYPHGIQVVARGSTSNLGAGFDCLGLCVEAELCLEVRPGQAPPELEGTLAEGPIEGEEKAGRAMRHLAAKIGKPLPPFALRARSSTGTCARRTRRSSPR